MSYKVHIFLLVLLIIFAISVFVRRDIPEVFSVKNIGPGNYRVLSIDPGISNKSLIVRLEDTDRAGKVKTFYAATDGSDVLKITALTDPTKDSTTINLVTLVSGLDISVLRTDKNEGGGLAFAVFDHNKNPKKAS